MEKKDCMKKIQSTPTIAAMHIYIASAPCFIRQSSQLVKTKAEVNLENGVSHWLINPFPYKSLQTQNSSLVLYTTRKSLFLKFLH